ncbi:aminotransferase class I/II [Halarcobacter ebronensis]|uniref:histidinol-phosphate transaminase n=1 Tax=Halarcobacter ebronensis TaxID=1462615 RepID=A0A4Q0YAU6_9BACT|nr:aminotransferase class I/II-fold pyridoxal phosphate-dependent enzyme [Halarcobacter ebronensis]RXJ66654.1 aminotransferase class I/II [Halarcobacter ebronensis]
MIDFSSEINFLKPNVNLNYGLILEAKSNSYNTLLELLENRYKVQKEQIELFNGFSSAIYSILKFLNKKFCFIYSPCSLEYKKAAYNLQYEVRVINRFENLFLPIKEQSVVIFANPSYLDGTYYELENLFKYWIEKEATVIVDETFLDFCGEEAAVKYLKEYKFLYILKDFSKYYSNVNLSISAIFSNQENISFLRKYEPENKISIFDVKYLENSLKDVEFRAISNSVNIKNRIELEKIFHSCKYVESLFHSSSNSLLIKLKEIDSKEFISKLEKKDFKIFDCMSYDFIDEKFLNIYVNSKDNIASLKEAVYAI